MSVLSRFLHDDAGGVTIDWVTLVAGILLLGIMAVYAIFNGGVSSLTSKVNSTLAAVSPDVDVGPAPDFSGGEGERRDVPERQPPPSTDDQIH